MSVLQPWSVTAANLPEHAENLIHTDEGAIAAGFPGALVAGATVYAYLTHVPMTAWGLDWLSNGGAEVRFSSPVMDRATVDCVPIDDVIDAQVDGSVKARCAVTQRSVALQARPGETLVPIDFVADPTWSDYGSRAGDDSAIYAEHGVLHPASWMRIANQFFHEQLVSGSWIHVRSSVRHRGLARIGSTVHADAVVVDRFDSRAGKRAIAHVYITADGQPVAHYEHEAIVELPVNR